MGIPDILKEHFFPTGVSLKLLTVSEGAYIFLQLLTQCLYILERKLLCALFLFVKSILVFVSGSVECQRSDRSLQLSPSCSVSNKLNWSQLSAFSN